MINYELDIHVFVSLNCSFFIVVSQISGFKDTFLGDCHLCMELGGSLEIKLTVHEISVSRTDKRLKILKFFYLI